MHQRIDRREAWQVRVTILILSLIGLATAGCSTTTQGSIGSPATIAWIDQHDSNRAAITFRGPADASELSGVLSRESATVPATPLPPTQTRLLSSRDDRAIPLALVQQVKVVKRGRGALEGALIGAVVGVAVGVAIAYSGGGGDAETCMFSCNAGDRATIEGPLVGGLGAVLGAMTGALVGHRDILTF